MNLLLVVAMVVGAYMLGSIPSAYLIVRLARGIDIRRVGSGNMGALNAFRHAGPAAGAAVLLFDTLKGILAVSLPWLTELPDEGLYLTATAVVAGHNWPIFLGLRGGKGAATVMGVSFAIMPWLTSIAVAFAIAAGLATRNVVAGAAMGLLVLNVLTVATGQEWGQVGLCLFLTIVVTATYLAASWRQTLMALRRGRWLDIFTFE